MPNLGCSHVWQMDAQLGCPVGGYVVVKALQQGLRLPPQAVMPSLAALRDYGNTSVSMTWYGEYQNSRYVT